MAFSGSEFSRLGLIALPRVVKSFLAKTEAPDEFINNQLGVVFIARSRTDIVTVAQESKAVGKI